MKKHKKNIITAASIVGFVFLAIASVDDEGAAGGTEEVTNTEAVFNVTDREIAKAFDENEVSANLTYENKVGTVTGKILEISKDFDVYSITLDGGDWTGVTCNFDGDVSKQLRFIEIISKFDLIEAKGIPSRDLVARCFTFNLGLTFNREARKWNCFETCLGNFGTRGLTNSVGSQLEK